MVSVFDFSGTNRSGTGSEFNQSQGTYMEGLLDDDTTKLIDLGLLTLNSAICVTGIIFNSVNLWIFCSIGLKDSVSVSFFALSLSDLCQLVMVLFNSLCPIIGYLVSIRQLSLFELSYLGVWFYYIFLNISILITTFISVQRCCCVAFPFQFKGVFTTTRTFVALIFIFAFPIACYTPLIAQQSLKTVMNPKTNSSHLVLSFTSDRATFLAFTDVLNKICMPISTQLVVIFCLAVFIISLRTSSRFRQSAAAITGRDRKNEKPHKFYSIERKELLVVKSVAFVSAVFVVCNTPATCLAFTRRVVPDFNVFRLYHNLHLVMNTLKFTFELISATFNIVIYVKFNSKYRDALFSRCACVGSFCTNRKVIT